MPDYSIRSQAVEIMDDLSAGGAIIPVTLRELETINRLLGGNHVTVDGILKLVGSKPKSAVSIADLGCGSGDILKIIRRKLVSRGIGVRLTGVDANPNIVAYATSHAPNDGSIEFICENIFSDAFRQRKFDIITATLFFHHFTDDELIAFFRQLRSQARIGIVINDIHRHWFAYHCIRLLTKWFSRSEMVRHDGPVSVLRAFRKAELARILRDAGCKDFSIRWMWAFRWQVIVKTA